VIGLLTAVLFIGYTLVYAAVANGGKFALNPWQALYKDAYADGTSGSSSGSHNKSTIDSIAGWFGKIPGPIGPAATFAEAVIP
jgi:hypothetical protein